MGTEAERESADTAGSVMLEDRLKEWDALLDSLDGKEWPEVMKQAVDKYGLAWVSRMSLRTDWTPEQRREAEGRS